MSDPSTAGNLLGGKKNFNDVKAHRRGSAGKLPHISVRSGDDSSLLLPSDRIFRLVSGQIVTGFNLDHHQLPPVPSDQINLSRTCPIIPREDLHPRPLEITGSHLFPVATGLSCVRPDRARSSIPRVKTIGDGSDKVRDPAKPGDVLPCRTRNCSRNHIQDITPQNGKGFGLAKLLPLPKRPQSKDKYHPPLRPVHVLFRGVLPATHPPTPLFLHRPRLPRPEP